MTTEDQRTKASLARRGVGVAPLTGRGLLRLTGPDRVKFLTGQCTQDIASLTPGQGAYAFVLDPKGRCISDLEIACAASELVIEVAESVLRDLLGWLARFIIISDVALEDISARVASWIVLGPMADRVLEGLGASPPSDIREYSWVAASWEGRPLEVHRTFHGGTLGYKLRTPPEGAHTLERELFALPGVVPLDTGSVEVLRVEAGRPAFGVDLGESVLPVESGQVERSVSFSKGCYTGQEVVARQHFLGKPRKVLRGLLLEGPATAGDLVATDADPRLGTVTTAVFSPTLDRWIALAILRGHEHPPGTRCHVEAKQSSERIVAEVTELPFVS